MSLGELSFLQCETWTQVALSLTFTAVWVVSRTSNGPSHRLDLQVLFPKFLISTKSPGSSLWSGCWAGRGRAAFTCCLIPARLDDKLAQYDSMLLSQRAVDGRGFPGAPSPTLGGAAKRISKGLMLTRGLVLILMYIRHIGKHRVHGNPVSSQHLASLFLRVPFSRSTAPPEAGWYEQCLLMSIP